MPAGLSACAFTLRADQHQREVSRVPVAGEAAEVMINSLEAVFILQTEDEDHGVNPQSKLQQRNRSLLSCHHSDGSCSDLVSSEIYFHPENRIPTGKHTLPDVGSEEDDPSEVNR